MLGRLILGGITLAVTGYGLKQYIDKNDKDDVIEDIKYRILDWIDATDKKTNDFFQKIIEKFDNGTVKEEKSSESGDVLEQIYQLKEYFYNKKIPDFLDTFSKIRNLPDFDMEQFYQLQQKVKRESASFDTLDVKVQISLDDYKDVFSSGLYVMDQLLNRIDKTVGDSVAYDTYLQEEKLQVENVYLLAVGLIKLCYTNTLDFLHNSSNNSESSIPIYQSTYQIKPQAKSFSSISILLCNNFKSLYFSIYMFNRNSF